MPRRVPREHRYLTHEQVHALSEASGEHGTIIRVLAYTGLRWGELAGLRVKHVDFNRRQLAEPVGVRLRWHFAPDRDFATVLQEHTDLLTAIASGDEARGAQCASDHVRQTRLAIVPSFEQKSNAAQNTA